MVGSQLGRADSLRHLYLVRHAEAHKNVEGLQGGVGTGLTLTGEAQARQLGAYLADRELRHDHKAIVYLHSAEQVRQTATAIANARGWAMEEDERLRGLDLGDLAGLTFAQARLVDAEAADRLSQWALGKLRVDHLNLPGAEDLGGFRQRVADCLERVRESFDRSCAVIVGTTSTMIMLQNLLTLGAAFSYELYRPYPFANGSVYEWPFAPETAKDDPPAFVADGERGR